MVIPGHDWGGLLRWIDVSHNLMSGTIPGQLGSLPMTVLNLGCNSFTGSLPHALSLAANLMYVGL